jgi:hypothetical protein
VDELDGRAARDRIGAGRVARAAGRIRRAQRERRPQPLAAGAEQMARDLGQEPVVGMHGVAQTVLDPGEIAGERRQSHVVDEACHHLAPSRSGGTEREPQTSALRSQGTGDPSERCQSGDRE